MTKAKKKEAPKPEERWEEGTVWIKSIDAKGGVSFTEHRCWNMTEFVKKQTTRMLQVGGKCEQVTEADYRKGAGLKPIRR